MLGGSTAGSAAIQALVDALLSSNPTTTIEVAGELDAVTSERVRALGRVAGLDEPLGARASSGAAVTAYEAACAGVPALLVVLAANQERVGRAFAPHMVVVDGRAAFDAARAVTHLLASRLAEDGPALVDGYGATRVRDALLALERGDPPPPVQRYRPATRADAADLLAWRNHPATRAARLRRTRSPRRARGVADACWRRRPHAARRAAGGSAIASVRFDRSGDEAELDPGRARPPIGGRRHAGDPRGDRLQLAAHPELRRVIATVNAQRPLATRVRTRRVSPSAAPTAPGFASRQSDSLTNPWT